MAIETFECFGCKSRLPRSSYGTRRDVDPAGVRKGVCKDCLTRQAAERRANEAFVPRAERYNNPDGSKTCSKCGESKDSEDFPIRNKSTGLRRTACYDCMRIANQERHAKNPENRKELQRRSKYGLNFGEYARMFEEQCGVCAICGLPETSIHSNGKPRSLFVDHDHNTGRVRSLLCMKCNIGLGEFNDNTDLMKLAIKYIEKHRIA